jgi:inorganic triphosphatase YgiF
MAKEVEIKLDLQATDVGAVNELLSGQPKRTLQRSTYYDTADAALADAGFSLRIRTAGNRAVQTIKSRGTGTAVLFARGEWEREAGDAPVLDSTTPLAGLLLDRPHQFRERFVVVVERFVWRVEQDGARIEVAFDIGEVVAADRRSALCEIELELIDGDPAALFALAKRIDAVAPARLGVLTKSDRGDRLLGAAPGATRAEPLILAADSSAADAFQQAANACIRQFRLNEMVLERHADDAALHQARVALRRLRSALSIWRDLLDDPVGETLRGELRWLSGVLGAARDLDVLIARTMPGALQDRLVADRADAYAAVTAALASDRARSTMLATAEWIATGRWLSDPATLADREQPAALFAAAALARYRRKIKRGGRDLAIAGDEARHEVRKDAKKLRYAADFFASLFPARKQRRRLDRFVTRLGRLQDRLGTLNDLATAQTLLADHAIDPADTTLLGARHRKSALIDKAERAHAALIDAQRFW